MEKPLLLAILICLPQLAQAGWFTPDIRGPWRCKECSVSKQNCSDVTLTFLTDGTYILKYDGEGSVSADGKYSYLFSTLTLKKRCVVSSVASSCSFTEYTKYSTELRGESIILHPNKISFDGKHEVDSHDYWVGQLRDDGYAMPEGAEPGRMDCKKVPLKTPTEVGGFKASVTLYDIGTSKAFLVKIPSDKVTEAIKSGKYSFPKGIRIPVISPDMERGTMDPEEAPEAFRHGYYYDASFP